MHAASKLFGRNRRPAKRGIAKHGIKVGKLKIKFAPDLVDQLPQNPTGVIEQPILQIHTGKYRPRYRIAAAHRYCLDR